MSRLYDTAEPSLVDEELLQKAVEEQGPQDQAGQIAKEEGIQYDEVCQLRLDYKNILKIDHLWQFTSLTKLQLDNNIIEKIEGLGRLTNLKWLDLSFNNIEGIEGLDSLVKLEDLSLYNNRISVIENMDTLLNLHVLSIGNNFLAQLENVIYLRKFKNLRTLNLAGNPICKEDRYKIFVAAYLPELVYLDFRLLDEQTREQAFGKYQYAIEEMRHNEAQERRAMDARQEQEDELQLHRNAFVELLNGPYLFDSMYADDAEAAKLAYLPGVSVLLETYKSHLVALCVQVFEIGLAQRSRREDEVKSFFDCSREAVDDNQQRAAQIAADFEKARRQVMSEMQQATDTRLLEAQLNHCSEEINQLCDSLMTQELQLVDQLEDIMKDFERNISDMVAGFIEVVQGIFAQCRDLENHHHEKLLEIAVATLERVAKNELEEDMPDDVRMLFVDKDTVINAVSASHDTHLLKIDNREDELMTRCNSWMSALMKSVQDEEVKRNRKRISEIHNYIDYVRDQLDEMQHEHH
ncbi:dynein regulatory complex subunit 3 [Salvelinus alpinus]|uniref:dynein regulatory complex subunit 3 n=1 Tax=Salvelinus alpinus TaxID=8036 RepID=UPI0039FC4E63